MADSTVIIIFSLLCLSASGFPRGRGPPNPYEYCQMTGNCPMPRNGLAFSPRNPLARMSNDFARYSNFGFGASKWRVQI